MKWRRLYRPVLHNVELEVSNLVKKMLCNHIETNFNTQTFHSLHQIVEYLEKLWSPDVLYETNLYGEAFTSKVPTVLNQNNVIGYYWRQWESSMIVKLTVYQVLEWQHMSFIGLMLVGGTKFSDMAQACFNLNCNRSRRYTRSCKTSTYPIYWPRHCTRTDKSIQKVTLEQCFCSI